jgi:hypothetical protein
MKLAVLKLLAGFATVTSMTLKERVAWMARDPKGNYSQSVAKNYIIESHFNSSIPRIRTFLIIQHKKSETTI